MTDPRDRILAAACALMGDGGRDAVTTRAVSATAGVAEPAIYRTFGDKAGLLDAVCEHVFAAYVTDKSAIPPGDDPVDDLRDGCDGHVRFGIEHPEVYALMYGDPRRGPTAATDAGFEVLAARVRRIAKAGRLTVPEALAVQLIHAVAVGVTLVRIAGDERSAGVPRTAFDSVIAAITTDARAVVDDGPQSAAVTLRARMEKTTALTQPESALMSEWLDRIAADRS
jgi:AcrR family transcriptional regulator